MENNDKIVKDFFSEHKQEIEDNGFSEKIMFALPHKKRTRWNVIVIFILGLFVSFFSVPKLDLLLTGSYFNLTNIPSLYILLGIVTIPFIIYTIWIYREHQIFG